MSSTYLHVDFLTLARSQTPADKELLTKLAPLDKDGSSSINNDVESAAARDMLLRESPDLWRRFLAVASRQPVVATPTVSPAEAAATVNNFLRTQGGRWYMKGRAGGPSDLGNLWSFWVERTGLGSYEVTVDKTTGKIAEIWELNVWKTRMAGPYSP